MRLLGHSATLSAFRWDLVHLRAQLLSDARPGVSDLAPLVEDFIKQITVERAAFEQAEDEWIVKNALLLKTDKHRDGVLIQAGGVARATDKELYATLFPTYNPSQTARLGVAAGSTVRALERALDRPAEVRGLVAEESDLLDRLRLEHVGDRRREEQPRARTRGGGRGGEPRVAG